MKKTLFMPLGIILCLSGSYAVDWEQTINETKKKQLEVKQRAKLIVKIDILMVELTDVGNDAIKSSESNLYVLTRVETDDNFRTCAITKHNLQKMKILGESAKELFDDREITKNQYNNYIKKLKVEMDTLAQTINTQCNIKG
jgi:hypothetical protein